jgi:hypothetical protein
MHRGHLGNTPARELWHASDAVAQALLEASRAGTLPWKSTAADRFQDSLGVMLRGMRRTEGEVTRLRAALARAEVA